MWIKVPALLRIETFSQSTTKVMKAVKLEVAVYEGIWVITHIMKNDNTVEDGHPRLSFMNI